MRSLVISLFAAALMLASEAGLFRSRGGCSSCANGQCAAPAPEKSNAKADAPKTPAPIAIDTALLPQLTLPEQIPQVNAPSELPIRPVSTKAGNYAEGWLKGADGKFYRFRIYSNPGE